MGRLNTILQREAEEQSKLLPRIKDLEFQNRSFASRVSQQESVWQSHESTATDEMRLLWDRRCMAEEDLAREHFLEWEVHDEDLKLDERLRVEVGVIAESEGRLTALKSKLEELERFNADKDRVLNTNAKLHQQVKDLRKGKPRWHWLLAFSIWCASPYFCT